jgi:hypothetical protein
MGRLFQELKRRSVFKVGAAYVVVAWVLLQVADLLVPMLTLPDWSTRLVFLLLVVGFVPALIIAWAYDITPDGIKRDEKKEADATTASKPGIYVTAAIFLLAIGAAAYWYSGSDARWAEAEAFPQIEDHAASGEWEEAYRLARRVEQFLPDSPTLAELWDIFAWKTAIPTTPPGATVYRQAYGTPDAPWELLGETPIYDIHIPLGLSLLRIELDGRPDLLRVIGGESNGESRLEIRDEPFTFFPQIRPGAYEFDSPESLPDGMVRVPGPHMNLDGDRFEIQDFYIDRYEVTNRQFRKFVDDGGYKREDLWEHEFILDGQSLDWDQAMARFVDKTGRPGASTWEAGSYPDGEDEHPVAGVSWYEAAAYARYVGRELATVHHWRRAFASGLLAWLLPLSNLDSEGTAPVGQHPGVGWTGTFDMVGNVREWCFNAVGEQRVILGGSWNEAPYFVLESVSDPSSMPPFDRSDSNGFRLARSTDGEETLARLREPVVAREELEIAAPASDEVFAVFLSRFDYDSAPLDPVIEETQTARHWTRQRISFSSGTGNERIALYLYLPETQSSPYQTIVFWPTNVPMLVDSIDDVRFHLDFALKNGRAVAFPVYDGTFERRRPVYPDWTSVAATDLVIQAIKDLRRSIDYLESRADIRDDSLAFYGHSWGGRLGAIALAVEPRLKVGILNQTGLQHLSIPETSVLNYLPRVSVPVLQFNGRYDPDFKYETSAKPFFELLGTNPSNKKHVVEPTGHFVPRSVVIGETLGWLDKYLGPVDR